MLGTLLFLSPLITPQIFAILCLLLPLSFLWTWNSRFWCNILDNFCLWVCVVPSLPRMGLNTLQGELGPSLREEAERCWSPSPVRLFPLFCSLRCTSFLVFSKLFLALPSARLRVQSCPWVTAQSCHLSFALTGEWHLEGAQGPNTAVICSQSSEGLHPRLLLLVLPVSSKTVWISPSINHFLCRSSYHDIFI